MERPNPLALPPEPKPIAPPIELAQDEALISDVELEQWRSILEMPEATGADIAAALNAFAAGLDPDP